MNNNRLKKGDEHYEMKKSHQCHIELEETRLGIPSQGCHVRISGRTSEVTAHEASFELFSLQYTLHRTYSFQTLFIIVG